MPPTDIWVEKTGTGEYLLIFGDIVTGDATRSHDFRTFESAMLAYTREVAMAAKRRGK